MNLVYKLKFIFSNPWKTLLDFLKNFTAVFGTISTLFGIADSSCNTSFHFNLLTSYIGWFIGGAALVSFVISIKWIPKISYKIRGTEFKISIKVGDISKYKGSIILSTNSSFITERKNDFISGTSAQGCFEDRFFNGKLDNLDKEILGSLSYTKPVSFLKIGKKKFPVFDIGTVAKIRHKNRNVYFLAINDVNSDGNNVSPNYNDFLVSLDRLWRFIKAKGNFEKAAIHLIASGHAGIKEVTKENSLKTIIDSYIGQCQNKKVLSELVVFIHPSDLAFIDVKMIKKYVENQCLFAKDNRVKVGTEES